MEESNTRTLAGDRVNVFEQKCTKTDDGHMVCEAREVSVVNQTSTTAVTTTATGIALPWYTLYDTSAATPMSCASGGLVLITLLVTILGFGLGF